jgi:hypothetical protein
VQELLGLQQELGAAQDGGGRLLLLGLGARGLVPDDVVERGRELSQSGRLSAGPGDPVATAALLDGRVG